MTGVPTSKLPLLLDYSTAEQRCRELLLVSACQTFGLGNWADIAEHIGSYRTKEEVEEHYLATYVNSVESPMPVCPSHKRST
jgi:hypothetical protein